MRATFRWTLAPENNNTMQKYTMQELNFEVNQIIPICDLEKEIQIVNI